MSNQLRSKLRWLQAVARAYPEEAAHLRYKIAGIRRLLTTCKQRTGAKGGAS